MIITFMEWVLSTEVFAQLAQRYLAEARIGTPTDFKNFARMFVTGIKQVIERGEFPEPLKQAALELDLTHGELEAHTLGRKFAGNLHGINPNDQEDVIMNAAHRYLKVLHKILNNWDHIGDESISPDQLSRRLTGTLQDYVTHAKGDYFKRFRTKKYNKFGKQISNISGEDDSPTENSYEDQGDSDDKLKINQKVWNNAIGILMKVKEKVNEDIVARHQAEPKKTTVSQEKRIKLLNTSIAMMRTLPSQMAAQLKMDDGGKKASGDGLIYMRLKSMISDPQSEIDPEDRPHLAGWAADDNSEYVVRLPKQIVASALWVSSGMEPAAKPKIISGSLEKEFPESNWFFNIVVNHNDIDADEDEVEEEEERFKPKPRTRHDDPKPNYNNYPGSSPVSMPAAQAPRLGSMADFRNKRDAETAAKSPAPAVHAAPARPISTRPVQRSLFDDDMQGG